MGSIYFYLYKGISVPYYSWSNRIGREYYFIVRGWKISITKGKKPGGSNPQVAAKAVEKPSKSFLRENLEIVILALVLALFIRTFIGQAFKIPSGSMEPTLMVGDHIMVNKFIYGLRLPFVNKVIIPIRNPKRGDVIVFIYPVDRSKDYIKRVVAVAGDTVWLKNKKLYINGRPADDTHAVYDDSLNLYPDDRRINFGPVTVPKNSIFVMGDNRDHSSDSRFWGFVDLQALRGKAFMIYWSWDSLDWRVRWNRLGDLIH